LSAQGLQFWPEVAQHNLDDYVDRVNQGAGATSAIIRLAYRRPRECVTKTPAAAGTPSKPARRVPTYSL
jgi:hypothetical protein